MNHLVIRLKLHLLSSGLQIRENLRVLGPSCRVDEANTVQTNSVMASRVVIHVKHRQGEARFPLVTELIESLPEFFQRPVLGVGFDCLPSRIHKNQSFTVPEDNYHYLAP